MSEWCLWVKVAVFCFFAPHKLSLNTCLPGQRLSLIPGTWTTRLFLTHRPGIKRRVKVSRRPP